MINLSSNPSNLTETIDIATDVPFPSTATDVPYKISNGKITLSVCSELLEYCAPLNTFNGKDNIVLINDENGQPMVFSLGTDKVLRSMLVMIPS